MLNEEKSGEHQRKACAGISWHSAGDMRELFYSSSVACIAQLLCLPILPCALLSSWHVLSRVSHCVCGMCLAMSSV